MVITLRIMLKHYVGTMIFFVILGIAVAAENYFDYADDTEKSPAENIHEFYRLLLRRSTGGNSGYDDVPLEHLMIRKSQRSPSLRLRFGRSGPHLSAGIVPRPMGPVAGGFDDNN